MKEIIVIVGPTAIGKTKLSIELAKRLDAEIINGDAISVYKYLNIGSSKPSIKEQESIKHHLLDFKQLDYEYSVFEYQKDVRKVIDDINTRGKRIIIVGGTGLYIKAALYDYKFSPNTIYNSYDNLDNKEIIKRLEKANLKNIPDINNRRRLVRLLNKLDNNELITYNKDTCLYPIKIIGLTTDRNTLYKRIEKRVDEMVDNGLLEEVNNLKKYYDKSRILNTAIGYKEFIPYFNNLKELDEVIIDIKRNTKRLAKRQYTFFNHQFDTNWYEVNFNDFSKTIDEVYKSVN